MFNVIEQNLGELVRSARALVVSKAEMRSLDQTKAVTGKIFKPVLFNMGIIVPIPEIVGNLIDRAVDVYRLGHNEQAAAIAADDEPYIECSPPLATRPSKILSRS